MVQLSCGVSVLVGLRRAHWEGSKGAPLGDRGQLQTLEVGGEIKRQQNQQT